MTRRKLSTENRQERKQRLMEIPEPSNQDTSEMYALIDLDTADMENEVLREENAKLRGELVKAIYTEHLELKGLRRGDTELREEIKRLWVAKDLAVLSERESCARIALGSQISETSLSAEWGRQCAAAIRKERLP